MMNHIPGIRVVPLYKLGYTLNLLGLRQSVVELNHLRAVAYGSIPGVYASAFDSHSDKYEAFADRLQADLARMQLQTVMFA